MLFCNGRSKRRRGTEGLPFGLSCDVSCVSMEISTKEYSITRNGQHEEYIVATEPAGRIRPAITRIDFQVLSPLMPHVDTFGVNLKSNCYGRYSDGLHRQAASEAAGTTSEEEWRREVRGRTTRRLRSSTCWTAMASPMKAWHTWARALYGFGNGQASTRSGMAVSMRL
jgi:hypothetical protein